MAGCKGQGLGGRKGRHGLGGGIGGLGIAG